MSVQIATNTDYMGRDAQELENMLQKCRKAISDMIDQMNQLDAMWDGDASEVYKLVFTADMKTCEEVCDILEKMINNMDDAKNKYNKAVSNVGDIVASIRV